MTGSVPIADRARLVSEFSQSASTNALFMSTRAFVGKLDLAATDTIIFYDCDWNPEIDLQIQNRARQISHTSLLRVFYFVTVGTIEEHLFAAREWRVKSTSISDAIGEIDPVEAPDPFSKSFDRKRFLQDAVLGKGPRLNLSTATNQDMISLLREVYGIDSDHFHAVGGIKLWPQYVFS